MSNLAPLLAQFWRINVVIMAALAGSAGAIYFFAHSITAGKCALVFAGILGLLLITKALFAINRKLFRLN